MTTHKIQIDNETINLKKSKLFGWGVVYPIQENGKINWYNLLTGGNWVKLIITIGIIIITLGAINEYYTAVKIANDCLQNSFIIKL